MEKWIDIINFSFSTTGILTVLLSLIFISRLRYLEQGTKKFFLVFFTLVFFYVLSNFIFLVFDYNSDPKYTSLSKLFLFFESFFSSLLIPALTYYLLSITKDYKEIDFGFRIICLLEAAYTILLIITQFTKFIYYFDKNGVYHRGPFYPVLLVPVILSMTATLIMLIRRKKVLTRRKFYSFLLFIIIPIISTIIQMFFFGILLIVIGTIVASLIMFYSILIEQIRAYVHQKELNDIYQTDVLLLQMRPHFIYNSLSSIYYLCELDPKKAQTVVRDFSIYLKKNFSALSKHELISINEEMEHTRAYLAIEKARYEKLLFVEYDIQNTDFYLPPLTLQPIVENAVKHGVDPDFPSLHIWVKTMKDGDSNLIIVENTGPDFTPVSKDDKQVHVGTTNVKKRLELMCGGTLKIAPRDGGGTVVTIQVP